MKRTILTTVLLFGLGVIVVVSLLPTSQTATVQAATTTFDDTAARWNYSTGDWVSLTKSNARFGTLHRTATAGATAELACDNVVFVKYIYTKSHNRGIVNVSTYGSGYRLVDSQTIDLYAHPTQWQASTVLQGAGPGETTLIVIRATGNKNPDATHNYVDVDAVQCY